MTPQTEEFDADAVFNKLYECVKGEINWNYCPDGHKVFQDWLNENFSRSLKVQALAKKSSLISSHEQGNRLD